MFNNHFRKNLQNQKNKKNQKWDFVSGVKVVLFTIIIIHIAQIAIKRGKSLGIEIIKKKYVILADKNGEQP